MTRRKPAYIRRLNARRAARAAGVAYGVQQPDAPPAAGPRACSRRQEGDEYVCHCGMRWDIHDDRPPCRNNGGY